MSKFVFIFSKTGNARYISHLDTMKVFRRAFSRARINVKFSQGFNPHPKLSLIYPLSLGHESLRDYGEIDLKEEEVSSNLLHVNNVLPLGFRIHEVLPLNDQKSLAQSIDAISYDVLIARSTRISDKIRFILDQSSLGIERESKKGKRFVDVRGGIADLSFSQDSIRAILLTRGDKTCKIKELISLLDVEVIKTVRLDLLKATVGGSYISIIS